MLGLSVDSTIKLTFGCSQAWQGESTPNTRRISMCQAGCCTTCATSLAQASEVDAYFSYLVKRAAHQLVRLETNDA